MKSWKSDPQNIDIHSTFSQHHTGYDQHGAPWGSCQPPGTCLLLERITTTSWTIHRTANEKTSHWGPSKQPPVILLKSVFYQVHSGFIFWQRHPCAKQESCHVQTRALIYSAGPQLSSTRWMVPPVWRPHSPAPTSLIPWAPEMVPRQKAVTAKRSSIENDA